ncbi:chorismate mutase [Nonomuraea sediminis]|uniref:chorismate mutase n=1 Tax=Nonomuraea sediminis TaxID=2835864 RepID=UPI001BDBC54A|nr:chorismate mutase [Nonomuraea sediminis]
MNEFDEQPADQESIDHQVDACAAKRELQRLRGSIDNLDAALVHLLAERFKCTKKVGRLKARYGLPPADPEREAQQVQRLRALAEESKLDPVFAERFLEFIIEEVVRHHELIAASASLDTELRTD